MSIFKRRATSESTASASPSIRCSMTMRPFLTRRTIVLSFIAALVLAAYFGWDYRERQSALSCIKDWGRLAPFPPTARSVQIETTGGMFTREFRASFGATPDDIERWLSDSPGIHDATAEKDRTTTTYHIRAGGGATFAEVIVDSERGTVRIRVYWS